VKEGGERRETLGDSTGVEAVSEEGKRKGSGGRVENGG